MRQAVLNRAIEKLAMAGERAGLSVEDMICMLDGGMSVEALLFVIGWSLHQVATQTSDWSFPLNPQADSRRLGSDDLNAISRQRDYFNADKTH
jgi:hypothetical protein